MNVWHTFLSLSVQNKMAILGQYISTKHNMLYKLWGAGLIRRRRRRRRKERRKNLKKYIYIWLTQTRTVSCYMIEPSLSHGDRPTTNKTTAVLTETKMWSWVPEGHSATTDGLTDRQLQSNSEWLTLAKTKDTKKLVCICYKWTWEPQRSSNFQRTHLLVWNSRICI
jgi:hypothetical protein